MIKKVAFYLAYLLGLFLILELALRFVFPIPAIDNFNRVNYQVLDVSEENGALLRNTNMLWESSPDTPHAFVHQLNNYGFRDTDWAIEKGEKRRVFILGDSFVEGIMSSQDATIPSFFAAKAKEDQVEVFNAGMMGIGLYQYIYFLQDAVPLFQPDEVLLVLYSNDMPFFSEMQRRKKLQAITNHCYDSRLIYLLNHIGKKDPIQPFWKKESVPFNKAVPDPRNPWTFQEAALKPHVKPEIAKAMKEGRFNYYRTNWYQKEAQLLGSKIDIEPYLVQIKSILEAHNCKLKVAYIPSRHQVSDYYYPYEKAYCQTVCPEFYSMTGADYQIHQTYLDSTFNKLNIAFKDFTADIRAQEQKGNHLYWQYDDHMKAKGYRLVGEGLYDFWKGNHN